MAVKAIVLVSLIRLRAVGEVEKMVVRVAGGVGNMEIKMAGVKSIGSVAP